MSSETENTRERGILEKMTTRQKIFISLAVIVAMTTTCGYQLVGKGGTFPAGVEKVAVKPFKNSTERSRLEGEAENIFIQELISTGKVTITSLDDADAWFEGVLTSYDNTPISFTASEEILERRIIILASVGFFIRGDEEPFFYKETARGRAEYEVSNILSVDNERESEAALRALNDLAGRVINTITEGF
jgi:hypothetical protein